MPDGYLFPAIKHRYYTEIKMGAGEQGILAPLIPGLFWARSQGICSIFANSMIKMKNKYLVSSLLPLISYMRFVQTLKIKIILWQILLSLKK